MAFIGYTYYLLNDWFEFKKHSLYVRLEFCPTDFIIGFSIVTKSLYEFRLLFFRIVIHWLGRRKVKNEKK